MVRRAAGGEHSVRRRSVAVVRRSWRDSAGEGGAEVGVEKGLVLVLVEVEVEVACRRLALLRAIGWGIGEEKLGCAFEDLCF